MIAYRSNDFVRPPVLRSSPNGSPTVARSILQEIELAIRVHGISAREIGRAAVGDPRFVHDLRRGRQARRGTRERVFAYLRALSEQGRA